LTKQKIIQSGRLGIYAVLLLLALLSYFFNLGFWNWSLLRNFYIIIILGVLLNGIPLFFLEKFFQNRKWLAITFVIDVLLISFLHFKSELHQSLFLFIYLFLILLAGLIFRFRGSILLASLISICFTLVSVLGPELNSMQFFFFLILNNIAFFAVAALAAYLGSEINILGEKLEAQNLTLATIRKLNEAVLETVPLGFITTNMQLQILTMNPGAHLLTEENDGVGKNLLDLIPELDKNLKLQEIYFGRQEDKKLLRVTKIHQEYDELTEATILYILEDLTQIRRLEESMRQTEKMVAIGQLAAGIAHEIRNPLTGISGSVEMLSQTSQNEDDQKLTKIILKEIDRLNRLITEFLEYAKPEKIPHDPVVLADLLQEVIQVSKVQQPANLSLQLNLEYTGKIFGQSDKLKQAFLNILINAYQALKDSTQPQVKIELKKNQDKVVLRIQDNGCGMKEEIKKRIFEPFMTTKPKGTGLGLAITHKILQSHQAEIVVESDLGRGTSFVISFPAGPAI
jgi:two-component system sensor histidine kinase PilS (NtrC family)